VEKIRQNGFLRFVNVTKMEGRLIFALMGINKSEGSEWNSWNFG
jgi:hypothetical protein